MDQTKYTYANATCCEYVCAHQHLEIFIELTVSSLERERDTIVKGQQMERPKPIACIKKDITIKEVLHYFYNHYAASKCPAVRPKGGELFLYSLTPHNKGVYY